MKSANQVIYDINENCYCIKEDEEHGRIVKSKKLLKRGILDIKFYRRSFFDNLSNCIRIIKGILGNKLLLLLKKQESPFIQLLCL